VHVEDAEVVDHPVAGLAFGRLDSLRTLIAVELAETVEHGRFEERERGWGEQVSGGTL
jgi:hypothetical protein